jgi:hypothetical protein
VKRAVVAPILVLLASIACSQEPSEEKSCAGVGLIGPVSSTPERAIRAALGASGDETYTIEEDGPNNYRLIGHSRYASMSVEQTLSGFQATGACVGPGGP